MQVFIELIEVSVIFVDPGLDFVVGVTILRKSA